MGRLDRRGTEKSALLFKRARLVFPGGVNHNARFYEPYPLSVSKARGKFLWDEDGNRYVDYWMGHMALILGHSPKVVVDSVVRQVPDGTHYGATSRDSVELGEEIQRAVPCAERVRFCNTGAEATMYLVRLVRGHTRRRVIVKIEGGWHGYNTDLNMGVRAPFKGAEGAGILPEEQAHLITARFNDLESAREAVRRAGRDFAGIFLEPVLGAGGCIPASREYLAGLMELSSAAGGLLAFDEIITGYRVALGGAQERYGVKPDIATLGKVVGGGLPIGLVCGAKEIMSHADPTMKQGFVSIGGGTFSENPLSMAAGLATVRYLRRNSARLYSRLDNMGTRLRAGVDKVFGESGIRSHTTGMGSLFLTHFGPQPANAADSAKEDVKQARSYAQRMMDHGVYLLPGHPGGISAAHAEKDVDDFISISRVHAASLRRGR